MRALVDAPLHIKRRTHRLLLARHVSAARAELAHIWQTCIAQLTLQALLPVKPEDTRCARSGRVHAGHGNGAEEPGALLIGLRHGSAGAKAGHMQAK